MERKLAIVTEDTADPAEIAHAVGFLSCPGALFIAGRTLSVDARKSLGGMAAI